MIDDLLRAVEASLRAVARLPFLVVAQALNGAAEHVRDLRLRRMLG